VPNLILALADPITVVMTVVGLGGLIFFHELGHFLACRVTGTRVETFSVGFGPKVFGWRRGHTLYKIGLVPLGGYVKMAAENPGEGRTGAPDELPSKSFSQRLLIFTAGVLFNVVLGFLLFVWAFWIGIPFESAVVGGVAPGKEVLEEGLRRGDRILAIDGKRIYGFDDVRLEVAFAPKDRPLLFRVERSGQTMELPVKPLYEEALGLPYIAVEPSLEPRAAGVVAGSPAAKAGGRKGDRIVAVGGEPAADTKEAFERVLRRVEAAPIDAPSLRIPLRVAREGGGEEEIAIELPLKTTWKIGLQAAEPPRLRAVGTDSAFSGLLRPGDEIREVNGVAVADLAEIRLASRRGERLAALRIRRGAQEIDVPLAAPHTLGDLSDSVAGLHESGVLFVAPTPGMPAQAAGLRAGDRVLSVGGKAVKSWPELLSAIRERKEKPVDLEVEREGGPAKFTVTPVRLPDLTLVVPDLGYEFSLETTIHRERNVLRALGGGWRLTKLTIESVILTIKGFLTQRISTKLIGGPISLAEMAYKTWERGLAHYLKILALISLNLAILNILPIPVLDGGQVVFLIAEKVRGRPLSERTIGVFQMVGLALILLLVFVAFRNDLTRIFGGN
jgi:regulator of sigma E protease